MAVVDQVIDRAANVAASATGLANRVLDVLKTLDTNPGNDINGSPLPALQALEVVNIVTALPAANSRPPGWQVAVMQGSGTDFTLSTYVRTNESTPRWLWSGGLSPFLYSQSFPNLSTTTWTSTTLRQPDIRRHQTLLFQITNELGSTPNPIIVGDLLKTIGTTSGVGTFGTQRINLYVHPAGTSASPGILYLRMSSVTTSGVLQIRASAADIDPQPLRIYGQ